MNIKILPSNLTHKCGQPSVVGSNQRPSVFKCTGTCCLPRQEPVTDHIVRQSSHHIEPCTQTLTPPLLLGVSRCKVLCARVVFRQVLRKNAVRVLTFLFLFLRGLKFLESSRTSSSFLNLLCVQTLQN